VRLPSVNPVFAPICQAAGRWPVRSAPEFRAKRKSAAVSIWAETRKPIAWARWTRSFRTSGSMPALAEYSD
jgi:hypothetical protein